MSRFATAFLALALPALAQTNPNCGNTLTSADPRCQVIQTGTLPAAWTVISRHGEYAQSETECNTPSQVGVAGGNLTITTIAASTTCGDFNVNGTTKTSPSSFPYRTGDVQWTSFNFKYGTVEIKASFPPFGTGLWPAFWLFTTACQTSNIYSGDTGIGGCPDQGQTGYTEIDFPECYGGTSGNWCQFHVANPSFGMGGGCDASYSLDGAMHVFQTVWTSTSITVKIDGTTKSTCSTAMTAANMFLIMQIQTGGAGGTPNNGTLPSSLVIDYVKVTDQGSNVIFFDDFLPPNAATKTVSGATTISGTAQ